MKIKRQDAINQLIEYKVKYKPKGFDLGLYAKNLYEMNDANIRVKYADTFDYFLWRVDIV